MQLLHTTKESLYKGIEAAQEVRRIGDIANAVQTYCERRGYTVVREMCGHGIGRKMHEDPEVPNYGRKGCGPVLKKGMCICIEPMINMGRRGIFVDEENDWTVYTEDGKPSAQWEIMVLVTEDGHEVLAY